MSQGRNMKISADAFTHVGKVRDENQDWFGFGINEELFVVADGGLNKPLVGGRILRVVLNN
jgi:hypothetical protein